MARAPIRRAPRWDRRRDDHLITLRSRGTSDERISQILQRSLSEIAHRVDELRAMGHEVRRRTPSARPTPRRRPEHVGALNTAEREVVSALLDQGLKSGAIAAKLGRAYAPVRAVVVTIERELHNG